MDVSANIAKAKSTPAEQVLWAASARLKAVVLRGADWGGCGNAPVVAGQSQAHPHEIYGLYIYIYILILTLAGPGTSFWVLLLGCSGHWVVVGPAALVHLCLGCSWDASWSQPGQEQELC